MIAIGVDPDTHNLAAAGWQDDGPFMVGMIQIPRKHTKQEAVQEMVTGLLTSNLFTGFPCGGCHGFTVEAQGIRTVWNKKEGRAEKINPDTIVRLANVAGAALLLGQLRNPKAKIFFPLAEEWKKGVPKSAHQARFYEEMGWGYVLKPDYAIPRAVPKGFRLLRDTDWKHMGDAILLARWTWRQLADE